MLLIELLVRLNGGFFNLKEKINNTNFHVFSKFYLLLYIIYLKENCAYVGHNTQFKSPPITPHGLGGIYISGESKIGNRCIIFQNVTIGSNTLVDSKGLGAPTIGDDCYIGSGACIVGGITIGNNCRIGANATVVQDVPDNSLVVSPKSIIINKNDQMRNIFYAKNRGKWSFFEEHEFIEETNQHIIEKLNNAFHNK